MAKINGSITFTVPTDKNAEEDLLGKKMTEWIEANPFCTIESREVMQSDSYISVVIFYSGQKGGQSGLGKF